jgi:hypothetical protein
VCGDTAVQVLDRLPYSEDRCFAVGEFLHRHTAENAIPNLYEAACRPSGVLLAKAVMLFSRSILNDFISGSFDRLAVMAFITPIESESKWILKWMRTYLSSVNVSPAK